MRGSMKKLQLMIFAAAFAALIGFSPAQAAQDSATVTLSAAPPVQQASAASVMPPAAVPMQASATAAAAPATPSVVVAPTAQGSAVEAIRAFYVQLTDAMKQGDQIGYSGRYKKLEPAIKTAFDLPLMTRFAVGPEWAKATPDEQQQLVSAFSDFSVATYANQFKSYDGEVFKIVDQKPAPDGGVVVHTQLVPKDGDAVALDYLMKPDEKGSVRIVDVYLDGAISQLAARRSEFTSIVRRDGIPALVNSLGDKTRQLGPS